MVKNYKRFIQNQFEKAKSTASEFISSKSEEQEESTIELNTQYYIELKSIADKQQTTVQAIVNGMIVQYLASIPDERTTISVDQKEDNPLLYLDGICKIVD
jgi:predicted DNA-binding ribbon-helix-helix protein